VNPDLIAAGLRDIHGLDAIPWWPLAPGWWLLAIGAVVLLWLLGSRFPRWHWKPAPRRLPWQRSAARELRELRRRIGREDPKVVAGDLSELLRRIAMARCGRESCAGLAGDAWLQWLQDHDPLGFDWTRHGTLLTRLPYAPPDPGDKAPLLQNLVDAAMAWTRSAAPACAGGPSEESAGAV
jgi:hypothetical protein